MKTENNIRYIRRQIEMFCQNGDFIIDATAGNGNDTLYLAEKFPCSIVTAFDVQEQAIAKTKERCAHLSNVQLVLDSHANVDKYATTGVGLAIFNLGYLPNADQTITTLAASTIEAIEKIMPMLKVGGAIVITLYRGESNIDETNVVMEYLRTINKDFFIVSMYDLINLNGNPYNVIIERK